MMCGGQGSETESGEGDPMERMRRHRRSHRGAGRARGAHTGRNWRGGAGTQGWVPTHPALPCLGTPPARRGGAGDRGRIHVPAALAAQPRDRRRSRSMRNARTGGPAGSGRLRLASAPALVAAAAAAPHSRPRLPAPPPPAASLRSRPRPTLQSHAAPARASPRGRPRSRPGGPSLGKAELEPSRQLAPGSRWDCARGPYRVLSAPRSTEKIQGYTGARGLQRLHFPQAPQEVAFPRKTAET